MKTRPEGNVIHAEFRRTPSPELAIRIKSELLYHDDHVMLTRATLTLGTTQTVTHFLAYRKSEGLEVIPVDA